MLRRWLLLVVCLAPAIGAAQPDPRAGRSAFEIVASLPQRLWGLQREGEPFDYERRLPGSGLGASVGYRFEGAGQGRATVYLYDGHVPPRAALDEADVRRQFQVAFREIEALGPRLRYRVLGTVSAAPIAAPGTEPALPCFRTLLAQESGLRVESFTCIGVMGARFVKLRMSLPLDGAAAPLPDGLLLLSPQREAEMTAFGAAMLAAMREALR